MKALFAVTLAAQILLVAGPSFARPVANPVALIQMELTTGRSDTAPMYDISKEGSQIRVTVDPNRCSDEGLCTAMAVDSELVTPTLIGNVEADGAMTISLTRGVYLIVTNKMNGDQEVHLEIIKAADGGPVQKLALKPLLKVGIEK
jgi:hypothetical protein